MRVFWAALNVGLGTSCRVLVLGLQVCPFAFEGAPAIELCKWLLEGTRLPRGEVAGFGPIYFASFFVRFGCRVLVVMVRARGTLLIYIWRGKWSGEVYR